jgi:EKC/KEOPS complex subunit CGI121/TPRKB
MQLCLRNDSMESLHFLHFQAHRSYAHIALFRNVSTSEKLKNRIVSASLAEGELGDREREAINFAFIDARLVSQLSCMESAIGY